MKILTESVEVNLLEKSDSQKYGLTTESVNQEPPEEADVLI